MQSFSEIITDPVYHQPLKYNWYERIWLKHMNDKRDLPFIRLLTLIHLTILPAAIVLYTHLLQGIWWWMSAVTYFYFSQFYFKGSFGLMLHSCVTGKHSRHIRRLLQSIYTGLFVPFLDISLPIFIIPFLFARLVMMIGNWAQHAFVDPDEPENDLGSTINCINTIYNHKCWNDGYHTIHHIRPGAHYTEYPLIFRENISRIARNKTLVFENIHYLHIFFYLVTKRYDKLAANLVNIDHAFKNEPDAIVLMKSRTKKFNEARLIFSKKSVLECFLLSQAQQPAVCIPETSQPLSSDKRLRHSH